MKHFESEFRKVLRRNQQVNNVLHFLCFVAGLLVMFAIMYYFKL
jgi:hypothetical protein